MTPVLEHLFELHNPGPAIRLFCQPPLMSLFSFVAVAARAGSTANAAAVNKYQTHNTYCLEDNARAVSGTEDCLQLSDILLLRFYKFLQKSIDISNILRHSLGWPTIDARASLKNNEGGGADGTSTNPKCNLRHRTINTTFATERPSELKEQDAQGLHRCISSHFCHRPQVTIHHGPVYELPHWQILDADFHAPRKQHSLQPPSTGPTPVSPIPSCFTPYIPAQQSGVQMCYGGMHHWGSLPVNQLQAPFHTRLTSALTYWESQAVALSLTCSALFLLCGFYALVWTAYRTIRRHWGPSNSRPVNAMDTAPKVGVSEEKSLDDGDGGCGVSPPAASVDEYLSFVGMVEKPVRHAHRTDMEKLFDDVRRRCQENIEAGRRKMQQG